MSTLPKIVRLVEQLLKATDEGRIHWESTANGGEFESRLAKEWSVSGIGSTLSA